MFFPLFVVGSNLSLFILEFIIKLVAIITIQCNLKNVAI